MACATGGHAGERFFDIKEEKTFNRMCNTQYRNAILLLFLSKNSPDACELSSIVKEYFEEVSGVRCVFGFVDCDSESTVPLRTRYGVTSVPHVLMVDSEKKVLRVFEDLDPVSIYEGVEQAAHAFGEKYDADRLVQFAIIESLLKENPVMLFIKGTPEAPECGFTRQLIEEMNALNVVYGYHNVMVQQGSLRNWVKEYSGWPTVPQVFVNGKIVGGLDKTREVIGSGEMLKMIPAQCVKRTASDVLEEYLSKSRAILFASSDFDGREQVAEASSLAIQKLQTRGLKFEYFDLKGKPEIEEQLKSINDGSPVELPALTLDRRVVCSGHAEISKLVVDGDLASLFGEALIRSNIMEELETLVKSAPLMIFIKGTPEQPQCGFTRQLLAILDGMNLKYSYFNIFSDQLVREKLKLYSNWKTYPQVYVNGEFVGGLDVVKELMEEGEFSEMTAAMVVKRDN